MVSLTGMIYYALNIRYPIHSFLELQGGANKTGQILTSKEMNIKSSILKILLNFKNWQAK